MQVMVAIPPGASVVGFAVRLSMTGGWFVTDTVAILLLVPTLPSDTSQVMVYVPDDNGNVQTTCEPVPTSVPVPVVHV